MEKKAKEPEVEVKTKKQFTEMLEEYDKEEEKNKEVDTYNQKGLDAMQNEKVEEAIAHLNKAIEIDPMRAEFYVNRS